MAMQGNNGEQTIGRTYDGNREEGNMGPGPSKSGLLPHFDQQKNMSTQNDQRQVKNKKGYANFNQRGYSGASPNGGGGATAVGLGGSNSHTQSK